MKDKFILQEISVKIEDYLDLNDDVTAKDLYVVIGTEEETELINDPLYMFCTPATEQNREDLNILCEFVGTDIIVGDFETGIIIENK